MVETLLDVCEGTPPPQEPSVQPSKFFSSSENFPQIVGELTLMHLSQMFRTHTKQ